MLSTRAYLLFANERVCHRALTMLSRIAPEMPAQTFHQGENLLAAIRQSNPRTPLLVTDDSSVLAETIRLGIFVPTILVADIRRPLGGRVTCTLGSESPASDWLAAIEFCKRVDDRHGALQQRSSELHRLTRMELNIVELAVDGVPNKTIATRLGVSIKTIEKYRRTAYDKLNVASAAEMASVITYNHFCIHPTSNFPASVNAA